jgi:hypothetical protein
MSWTKHYDGSLTYEDSGDNFSNSFIFDSTELKQGYIEKAQFIVITSDPNSRNQSFFSVDRDKQESYPLNGQRWEEIIKINHDAFEVLARIKGKEPVIIKKLDNNDYECIYELEADWENLFFPSRGEWPSFPASSSENYYKYTFSNLNQKAKNTKFVCTFRPGFKKNSRTWIKAFQLNGTDSVNSTDSANSTDSTDSTDSANSTVTTMNQTIKHNQDMNIREPTSYYLLYPNHLELKQITCRNDYEDSTDCMVFSPTDPSRSSISPTTETANLSKGFWIMNDMKRNSPRSLKTMINIEFSTPIKNIYDIRLYGIVPACIDPLIAVRY